MFAHPPPLALRLDDQPHISHTRMRSTLCAVAVHRAANLWRSPYFTGENPLDQPRAFRIRPTAQTRRLPGCSLPRPLIDRR